jgi:hypothetical protein
MDRGSGKFHVVSIATNNLETQISVIVKPKFRTVDNFKRISCDIRERYSKLTGPLRLIFFRDKENWKNWGPSGPNSHPIAIYITGDRLSKSGVLDVYDEKDGILLLVISLLVASDCCDSNSWRGLTPLKTTRAQVEKVLGKPMPHSVNPHAASYETDAGRVSVLYSSGSCTSQDKSGWDVPELTIIDIKFYPKSPPDFAGLKIDLKNFEKSAQPGSIGIDEYSNYRDGIAITVDTDEGTATSFRYFPNQRDKSRICKN